ncbi:MAG: hypothetical protein L3J70_09875 [Gammaproteobacteria bacterium]|nr:hypothetical protein [Gammaproteobacteria bacterium]
MFTYKKIITTSAALLLGASLSFSALAADDPSIKGDLRTNVQQSMNEFINNQTIDGSMYVYDSVKGGLLKLKLDKLHDGIVKKGDFYVSCADFKDQNGNKVDVDFMVRPSGDKLITTQALLHKVDGKKRKYHLESM